MKPKRYRGKKTPSTQDSRRWWRKAGVKRPSKAAIKSGQNYLRRVK